MADTVSGVIAAIALGTSLIRQCVRHSTRLIPFSLARAGLSTISNLT